MLYFIFNAAGALHSVSESGHGNAIFLAERLGGTISSRWDFKTFGDAQKMAEEATKLTGTNYLPIDNGEWVSPRYDVIEAPKVGDKVSYAFNGDYYPDGEIVKIGKDLKIITTSTGKRYYRRRLTARWVQTGGTWTLVQGHINDKNPDF